VHICEFCHTQFQSRPQVKRPRACQGCQKQRQRSNEKDWRSRNPQYSCAEYHDLMREKRNERLAAAAAELSKCITVGRDFLGIKFKVDALGPILAEFFHGLGVRRLNKFWDLQLAM